MIPKVKLQMSTNVSPCVLCFCPVLLSVVGNGMILLVFYWCRSKMVGLEVLSVSLALVDFLCCIVFYPLSIYSSFHHIWLGGSTSCTYYGFGCNFFALCSKLTVTAISLVRYLKICRSSVSSKVAGGWTCVAHKKMFTYLSK